MVIWKKEKIQDPDGGHLENGHLLNYADPFARVMEAIFYLTPQDDKTSEKFLFTLHGHGTYEFDPTIRHTHHEAYSVECSNKDMPYPRISLYIKYIRAIFNV